MSKLASLFLLGLIVSVTVPASAEDKSQKESDSNIVVSDDGVSISENELRYVIQNWTPELRKSAATDGGDRIELLNQVLAIKKIAAQADDLTPEADGDVYWDLEMRLRQAKQVYMVKHFMATLEVPDMTELSKERYETEKRKYAHVLEQRSSSHILIRCDPRNCNGEKEEKRAQEALAKLKAGEKFEELAKEYSEDPGSKSKGGKFDAWLNRETTNVDGAYLKSVFLLDEPGDYTDVVRSQFGFHIIRLDEIKPAYDRPYDEVKDRIIAALENEYKQLTVKAYDDNFRFTDEVYIDNETVDKLLEPYLSEKE
ncbi:peptidylprolyl isomerase [Parahaliea mediterranea]|uniref:peptidylprolyl isomerase n=1 Tax=Parahaliea mediterranea TaxID=651086 RepID=UPI000E2E9960|nr:peptidylprolyl isomerase [Parahaliea mediterranea]